MRIAVASAYGYWGNFTPKDIFEKTERDVQVGGGETAMINISTELAKRGHDVDLFYDIDYPGDYYGVHYLPTSLTVAEICTRQYDVLVSWDVPGLFRFNDRAKVHVMAFQLNDPYIGVYDWAIDLYMHPSQWHADRCQTLCPEITKSKSRVRITNGINFARYLQPIEKVPGRVIYSSSPDRGLHHLLRIWPEIAARVPGAELHVYYDMKKWLAADAAVRAEGAQTVTSERAILLQQQILNLPPSVHLHGGVGQYRLAEEQLKAQVLAYPCDPVRPTEGFSMTILEGIAAGCNVVTSNADAFPELWSKAPEVTMLPLPIDDNVWVNAIVDALAKPTEKLNYSPKYAWATLAEAWEREILACLMHK